MYTYDEMVITNHRVVLGIRSDIASVVSDVTSYDSAKLDEIISLPKEISDKLDR